MTETPPGDPSPDPLAALRRRWALAVVLTLLGAGAGFAFASRHETSYTAETRLVVGSQSLDAYRVAGYAVASEALAADYARYVDEGATTTDTLTAALGRRASSVSSVGASPIPDSNVVRVEVTAADRGTAVAGADAVAADLVASTASDSTAVGRDLLAQYRAVSRDVARAMRQVDLAEGRRERLDLQADLDTLRLRQASLGVAYQQTLTDDPVNSALSVVQPAAVTGDDSTRTLQVMVLGGAGGGLALALLAATLLGPRLSPRRRPSRVAAPRTVSPSTAPPAPVSHTTARPA